MRHGQMRLAADELNVTYSAVSRQVWLLEEILGVPLFQGPRNKLVPTEAALDLQPALQDAFDRRQDAVQRVMYREKRMVDVSYLSTLAMCWLIPRLADFQALYPGIEIRLTADDGPVDFSRQRLDVAIRIGRGPWDEAATTLFADAAGPVLSPKLADPSVLRDPRSLLGLPLLHTKARPAAWPNWCRLHGLTPPAGGRVFEHFYFMLEAATAGIGVVIAPEVLARDDLAAGRLVAPHGFKDTGQFYVALLPRHATKEAQAFVRWLETLTGGEEVADFPVA